MTELLARENGYAIDKKALQEMDVQKKRRVKLTNLWTSHGDSISFSEQLNLLAMMGRLIKLRSYQESITLGDDSYLVFDKTPFYAEMGGQMGDQGTVFINDQSIPVTDVIKIHTAFPPKLTSR